jgi:hypothetical protein
MLTARQDTHKRRRQGRPIQRMGRSPRAARIRREHRHRLPPPHPPLLPRRDCRHTSHALPTRSHGFENRRPGTSSSRLSLRIT